MNNLYASNVWYINLIWNREQELKGIFLPKQAKERKKKEKGEKDERDISFTLQTLWTCGKKKIKRIS